MLAKRHISDGSHQGLYLKASVMTIHRQTLSNCAPYNHLLALESFNTQHLVQEQALQPILHMAQCVHFHHGRQIQILGKIDHIAPKDKHSYGKKCPSAKEKRQENPLKSDRSVKLRFFIVAQINAFLSITFRMRYAMHTSTILLMFFRIHHAAPGPRWSYCKSSMQEVLAAFYHVLKDAVNLISIPDISWHFFMWKFASKGFFIEAQAYCYVDLTACCSFVHNCEALLN